MIARLLPMLFGGVASKAAGAAAGFGTLAAVVGAVAWLFGPGREWSITLNALELSGVALGASLLIEWVRRMPPPGAP